MSNRATNVGVVHTAAVSLVVGMMTLGMPLAALAAGPATFGVDDGTHITLWSRAATQARADALVKAYNATHKNHIDATYCSRPTSCSCRTGPRRGSSLT